MSEEIDSVKAVVTGAMVIVEEVLGQEASPDVLESMATVEEDAERAVVLLTATRDRLTCMEHFLADECPEDCIEGQLQYAIDVFLQSHVLPEPKDQSKALGRAIDLATSGYRVTIDTRGNVRAMERG